MRDGIETQGLFSCLYTDWGSHYWNMEGEGGNVDKIRLTQVYRALQQLGITVMAAANEHLAMQFLPAYNQRFAVSAPEAGTVFVRGTSTFLAEIILSVHDERVVAKDNIVHYHRQRLTIP